MKYSQLVHCLNIFRSEVNRILFLRLGNVCLNLRKFYNTTKGTTSIVLHLTLCSKWAKLYSS